MPPNSETSTIDASKEPVQQQMAENFRKFIVKYRKDYYDITDFLHKHPGGINTLKGLQNGDMTGRFMKAPPHSDAAMYLMQEYKILNKQSNLKFEGQVKKELQENMEIVEDYKYYNNNSSSSSSDIIVNSGVIIDESMEHLVDWSRAMLPQIPAIAEHYDDWVHKPVDRPLRLFEPWYLEIFTKTPWWLVLAFWLPVITKLLYNELLNQKHCKVTQLTLYFLTGILLWTFLEYTLHRFVFHMQIKPTTKPWLCTFHFMIHGLHHKVPFDPMRLVFPPLPGAIIASVLYAPLALCVPQPRVILAGALFGYLCYDMIHYYLHYGSPSVKHLYHMKRYHYQHHFSHQDLGYGISSPLWDFVFNTRIHLRKLRYHLKWE